MEITSTFSSSFIQFPISRKKKVSEPSRTSELGFLEMPNASPDCGAPCLSKNVSDLLQRAMGCPCFHLFLLISGPQLGISPQAFSLEIQVTSWFNDCADYFIRVSPHCLV
jgi:hypothetical protein